MSSGERKVECESQVQTEKQKLTNAIGELESVIDELSDRLSDVLVDAAPDNPLEDSEGLVVPLAREIRASRQRVSMTVHRLQDILSRIEL